MPVETRWYVDKRILYQRFYGDITLEDFKQSVEAVGAFVAEGHPLVHAIADVLDVEKWPPLTKLSKFAPRQGFPGMGWTLIIVSSPALRFVTGLLVQFTMSNFRMAATLNEALEFLTERDNTLTMP
ncbi:MAG: hypothetical protein K8L97_14845 [Anaerolineae bacterium]|nr:hypothetical protein [Anaerolineae bacterium]